MKIRSVEGRTDRHDVDFNNFAKAPGK